MDDIKDLDIQSLIKKIAAGEATSADIEKLVYAYSEVQKAKQKLNQRIKTPENLESHFKEQVKLVRDNQKILKEVTDVEEDILNLHEEAMHLIKDKIDTMILEGEYTAEELKEYQKLFKQYANRARRKRNHLLSIQKGEEYTKTLLAATLGLSQEWQGINASGFLKGFAQQLKRAASLTNVVASLATGMIEQVFMFDTAASELFKQTGITRNDLRIKDIRKGIDAIGTGIPGHIKESIEALHSSYRGFSSLSKAQVIGTAELMTVFGQMGASQQAQADIFAFHKHTLEESPEQAGRTLLEMNSFSQATGRHINEVMTEYAKSIPILAMYEHNSKNIFKGLSKEAQILNMEVSELLGMSLQMDTFEGAARAAQNFNVAFGGPFLSAQALMAASVEDKYKLIAEAFKRSGAKLSRRQISGLAKDQGLDEQKMLQILNRESDKVVNTTEKLKSTEQEMADNQNLIKQNLDIQTTALANLEKFYASLAEKFDVEGTLRSTLLKILQFLNFIADNFKVVFGTLVAIKGLQAIMAARGVTPMMPTFVSSLLGGGKFGKMGKLGKGLAIAAGVAAVGGAAYMSTQGRMNDLDNRIQESAQTEKRFQQQDKFNEDLSKVILGAKNYANTEMADKGYSPAEIEQSNRPMSALAKEKGFDELPPPGSGANIVQNSPAPLPARPSAGPGNRRPKSMFSNMPQAKSNDRYSALPMTKPSGPSGQVKVVNNSVNQEANYVQPVFHKNDKFYNVVAAKPGGDLITALASLQDSLDKYYEMRKNSSSELTMEGREFIRAWKENINEYG